MISPLTPTSGLLLLRGIVGSERIRIGSERILIGSEVVVIRSGRGVDRFGTY